MDRRTKATRMLIHTSEDELANSGGETCQESVEGLRKSRMLVFPPSKRASEVEGVRPYVFRNQEVVDKLDGPNGHEEGQERIDQARLVAGGLPVVGPDLLRGQR